MFDDAASTIHQSLPWLGVAGRRGEVDVGAAVQEGADHRGVAEHAGVAERCHGRAVDGVGVCEGRSVTGSRLVRLISPRVRYGQHRQAIWSHS